MPHPPLSSLQHAARSSGANALSTQMHGIQAIPAAQAATLGQANGSGPRRLTDRERQALREAALDMSPESMDCGDGS